MSIKTPQKNHLLNPVFISLFCSGLRVYPQARILECVAISFSRRFSQPWDRTQVCLIAGRLFTIWATREASIYSYLWGKKDLLLVWKSLQAKITPVFLHCSAKSKVLNLLSAAHLPGVRIEGLNRYLRWQVYWAFELQFGVTASMYNTLIQPWYLGKHTRTWAPNLHFKQCVTQ